MFQTVWEGLAQHKWSDAQLATLDVDLARFNYAADYRRGMHGELTGQSDEMALIRRRPERICWILMRRWRWWCKQREPSQQAGCSSSIPNGWLYQNEYRTARMMEDFYFPVADVNAGTFSPDMARRGDDTLAAETKPPGLFNIYERIMLAAGRSAMRQGNLRMARHR